MNHNDILGVTMAGLEAGFKVAHIAAFDLEVCAPDVSVRSVLDDPRLVDFDHIPVKQGSRIVGMLDREPAKLMGSVRDHMHPLDGEMLVSAEEPLPGFLPTLAKSKYRLVVRGTEIAGIVTLSDVAKLPVRLLAFTSVAHLEAVLTEVIRRKYPHDDEAWLLLLDKDQRGEVVGRLKGRKKQNIHLLSSIEVAGFRHKLTAVGKLQKLTRLYADRESIVTFRNSLAHDGDFVKECRGVEGLLERLSLVRHWIDILKYDRNGQDKADA